MRTPLLAIAALVLSLLSCADDNPKLSVSYAPGFKPDGHSISVFGVFRDGRINPEAWDDLGPRISSALHKPSCDIAMSNGLRALHASVYNAVDGVARRDGVTDELLAKLEPAAAGDSILVITVAGRVSNAKDGGVGGAVSETTTTAAMQRMGGGRRGGGAPQHHTPPPRSGNALEITASLYSKRQHESVAMVSMTYVGSSEQEAIAKLTEKLASTFPGATCAGWNEDLGLDPAAIERLGEP